jgi:hypothetical protein
MTSKFTRGPALRFLLRFLVIFGLLIAPWPGLNQAYSGYFQSLGQMVFGSSGESPRKVTVEPSSGERVGLDTRIILQNTAFAASDGKKLLRAEEIDSRSIGWVPTALTVALVLATPIPWTRRLTALAGGLVLIHLFIFLSLQSWIWNNSPSVSLLTLSSFWQQAVDELNYALMNQLGISFTVPVVIWTLVTFRRQDQNALAT